jgi:hypothetical protein
MIYRSVGGNSSLFKPPKGGKKQATMKKIERVCLYSKLLYNKWYMAQLQKQAAFLLDHEYGSDVIREQQNYIKKLEGSIKEAS